MSEYVVWYGRRDEPHTTYRKSEQWLAVRTHTGRSLENDSEAHSEVDGHAVVMGFPEVGVQVFQVATEFSAHRDRLQQSPEVRFAGAALVEASSGQPAVSMCWQWRLATTTASAASTLISEKPSSAAFLAAIASGQVGLTR